MLQILDKKMAFKGSLRPQKVTYKTAVYENGKYPYPPEACYKQNKHLTK